MLFYTIYILKRPHETISGNYGESSEKIFLEFHKKGKYDRKVIISSYETAEYNGKFYRIDYIKSYDINKRKISYTETFLGPSTSEKEVLSAAELPSDQLPEELKNIDYKTKIDEIDKLLEERWNKACNPKTLK